MCRQRYEQVCAAAAIEVLQYRISIRILCKPMNNTPCACDKYQESKQIIYGVMDKSGVFGSFMLVKNPKKEKEKCTKPKSIHTFSPERSKYTNEKCNEMNFNGLENCTNEAFLK